ncbi:MAG TPA: cytochrome d ubiquinol oxidase subunit II [Gaiellaceae bacterium]|nr:cytochrome d ubiquinol oxidase subunit II [Gaiellaceae bacterium]
MTLLASAHGYWNLQTFWFFLIVVLWIGYFVLEGFDFGVGTLLPFVGRDVVERGTLLRTIGPVWDGNEVWLLVAGGATFAAFPGWYASLFSGFYLALFLVLVGLIVRGVAIEYRNKQTGELWRSRWDRILAVSSAIPALLWGVALADVVHGVPIDAHGEFTGNLLSLLGPYALFGGLTSLALFTFHGALFLTLRTTGELHARARRAAFLLALPAAALVFGFLVWTYANAASAHEKGIVPGVIPITAMVLPFVAWMLVRAGKDGWAFAATAASIALITLTLYLNLYPRAIVSSTASGFSPTIFTTSSSHYTLVVMSIVAVVFTPVVLAYQAWTYWVFRARLGDEDAPHSPLELLERSPLGRGTPQPGA